MTDHLAFKVVLETKILICLSLSLRALSGDVLNIFLDRN